MHDINTYVRTVTTAQGEVKGAIEYNRRSSDKQGDNQQVT